MLFPVKFLSLLLFAAVSKMTNGFSVATLRTRQVRTSLLSSSSNSGGNVDTIQLDKLGDDHEQVAKDLGASVQRWLDAEWMPQEIHAQIGVSCGTSYILCRRDKETDDIMTIMTQVAEDLSEVWYEKYDQDAFVNAWDIANYVSDYLTAESGNETCECSAKIH